MSKYADNFDRDPMEELRDRNCRSRKVRHRFRCPVCFKSFQNWSNPLFKHIETHSLEEIEKWAPNLMKYVVDEEKELNKGI